jgi:hypothetical protein
MINRSLISHMEKLLVAHVERLPWSRLGSNPVPFGPQSNALSTKLSGLPIIHYKPYPKIKLLKIKPRNTVQQAQSLLASIRVILPWSTPQWLLSSGQFIGNTKVKNRCRKSRFIATEKPALRLIWENTLSTINRGEGRRY